MGTKYKVRIIEKIEGTGRTDRLTVDKWTQVRKSKETKWIMTLRKPINMALMTKLMMTSSQPTIK